MNQDDQPISPELPPAYGKFQPKADSASDLKSIGWEIEAHLVNLHYAESDDSGTKPKLITERALRRNRVSQEVGKFRRRRCDPCTFSSTRLKSEVESQYEKYFPYPYSYSSVRQLDDETATKTIQLTLDEFCKLAYLFPLSSVLYSSNAFGHSPFAFRAWIFQDKRRLAFVKKCHYQTTDGATRTGACIVSAPPDLSDPAYAPFNYQVFRAAVGHEIGHLWWDQDGASLPELKFVPNDPTDPKMEQVVSLFSVFLCMYRGRLEREALSREEIALAFDSLRFETRWAQQHKDKLIDSICKLDFPHVFDPPQTAPVRRRSTKRSKVRLDETEIECIRREAVRVARRTRPLALASAAAVINCRKCDSVITFDLKEDDPLHTHCRWRADDIVAHSIEYAEAPQAHWREYQVTLPVASGKEMSDGQFLDLAFHLACIRLFGKMACESDDAIMASEDVFRKCTDADRDCSRIVALASYVSRGRPRRSFFEREVARALLMHDHNGLSELAQDVDHWFEWCTIDPDGEDAKERFIARIESVTDSTIHFTFRQDDDKVYRSFLPVSAFYENGFTKLPDAGEFFKLFYFTAEQGLQPRRTTDPVDPAPRDVNCRFVANSKQPI